MSASGELLYKGLTHDHRRSKASRPEMIMRLVLSILVLSTLPFGDVYGANNSPPSPDAVVLSQEVAGHTSC